MRFPFLFLPLFFFVPLFLSSTLLSFIRSLSLSPSIQLTKSKEWIPSWEANSFSTVHGIFRILKRTQNSLPFSQQPATCHFPKSDEYRPYPPNLLIWDRLQYISIRSYVFQVFNILQVYPPKHAIFSAPVALHAPPISLSLLLLP